MIIVKQVQHLQTQLEELNQVNIQLEAKINVIYLFTFKIKDKEKRKLDIDLRHFKQENA